MFFDVCDFYTSIPNQIVKSKMVTLATSTLNFFKVIERSDPLKKINYSKY